MKCRILVALTLVGCWAAPDFYTKHGVAVFVHVDGGTYYSAPAMSKIEDDLIAGLEGTGWPKRSMERALGDEVQTFILPDIIRCPGQPNLACDGYEQGSDIHVVDDPKGCPAASAYAHELGHWFHEFIRHDNGDPKHADPTLWPVVRELADEGWGACQ